jgi:hypothetical protein
LANIKSVVDFGKSKIFDLFSQQCQFTLFYLSHCHHRHMCHIFQYFRQLEIFSEKVALHLDEMDTDPDRQALDADPGPDPSK